MTQFKDIHMGKKFGHKKPNEEAYLVYIKTGDVSAEAEGSTAVLCFSPYENVIDLSDGAADFAGRA